MVEPASWPATGADRFDHLFVHYYPEMYGLARMVLGERGESEDAVQEAFVRLIDAPVRDRPDDEVRAWLRRVCLNLSFNGVRDQRRARDRLERAGRLELVSPAAENADPAGIALRNEAQADVRRALARLSERQRNCLILRHSGYAYAEIAASLDVAPGSVGQILARAERAFRDAYQENENDQPDPDLS